jgi:hypothetical protein
MAFFAHSQEAVVAYGGGGGLCTRIAKIATMSGKKLFDTKNILLTILFRFNVETIACPVLTS